MAEVSEVRKTQRARRKSFQSQLRTKSRRSTQLRPDTNKRDQERSNTGGDGSHNDSRSPVQASNSIQKMRRGGTQSQRPNQQGHNQTHVVFRPAGRHFHPDWINSGHANSDDEPQSRNPQ